MANAFDVFDVTPLAIACYSASKTKHLFTLSTTFRGLGTVDFASVWKDNAAMLRRTFLASPALAFAASNHESVRLGVDVFSLRTNFTPFQCLDYCAGLKVKVVHFSEIRFLG